MKSVAIFHKRSLISNALVHSSLFGKMRGLMFKRRLRKENSILLQFEKEGLHDIHMLFVFQPIDAVWVNKKKEVVQIKKNIKPFTPHIDAKKKAKYIIELPTTARKKVKVGDKLQFNPIRKLDAHVFEK